jgi:PAS domain S-box-containing protein
VRRIRGNSSVYGTTARAVIPLLSVLLVGDQEEDFFPFATSVADIIQAGAWDCAEKSLRNGADLLRTIRCTLNLHAMRQKRNSAEDSLRKLSCAAQQSADTIMITNSEGIIEYVNAAFESLAGYSSEKAVGQTPSILTSGQPAPALYRELWETISIGNVYHNILVDVVMPRISGGQLVKELTAIRPGTRVLFVSGYAGQTILDHKVVDVENNFLQKPFTVRQLAVKVRAVLDRKVNALPLPAEPSEQAHRSTNRRELTSHLST